MRIFFDTSALAKLYVREAGSEKIVEMANEKNEICASVLCLPEIFAVLNRAKRAKIINLPQYQIIKQSVLEDFKRFQVCDLSADVVSQAIVIFEEYSLKTLDALHLACAIKSRASVFVSADKQQTATAEKLKLTILPI
jgi:predicted nucleic acid-binding protein